MSKNSEEQIKKEIEFWKKQPYLKMQSLKLTYNLPSIYGGRGFIATEDIKPGTILLQEVPIMKLKSTKVDEMLDEIFKHKDYKNIIQQLSFLHPIILDHLEKQELINFRLEHDEIMNRIYDSLTETQKKEYIKDDILKIALQLRFNGFSSGIYIHLSIFNHSCKSNCIKFAPEQNKEYSEVVAIQHIKKGTELTINYLTPFEQSTEKRKKDLLNQFHFNCKCPLCESDEFLKFSDQDVPRIEKKLGIINSLMQSGFYTKSLNSLKDLKEEAKLDENNLLLLRMNKMMIECCAWLLENDQGTVQVSIFFLKLSLEIYKVQILLYPDHCDVATICNDISNGIESLLNFDRNALFDNFKEMEGKQKALEVRKKYYNEFKRISELYDK